MCLATPSQQPKLLQSPSAVLWHDGVNECHADRRERSTASLHAQGKKAKAAARPRTYSLHGEEDGWEGIQDAQNAAATRALFQV